MSLVLSVLYGTAVFQQFHNRSYKKSLSELRIVLRLFSLVQPKLITLYGTSHKPCEYQAPVEIINSNGTTSYGSQLNTARQAVEAEVISFETRRTNK